MTFSTSPQAIPALRLTSPDTTIITPAVVYCFHAGTGFVPSSITVAC